MQKTTPFLLKKIGYKKETLKGLKSVEKLARFSTFFYIFGGIRGRNLGCGGAFKVGEPTLT